MLIILARSSDIKWNEKFPKNEPLKKEFNSERMEVYLSMSELIETRRTSQYSQLRKEFR